MTDRRIHQVAVVLIASISVVATAIGFSMKSPPWLLVGAWFGVTLALHLTRKP